MKKDLCEIIIVLDESGSMSSCKYETINGVNLFLNNQKKIKGEAKVTLVKFSDYYNIVNDAIPLNEIVYLNESNYIPSNTTALLDAVGFTINRINGRLENTPDHERADKVIFAVITDGYENASREFKRSQILEMVSERREKSGWEFIFLGADIISWGEEIGFTVNVDIRKNDMQRSFKGLSLHVLCCRINKMFDSSDSFGLTEEQIDRKLDKIGNEDE